MKFSTKDNDHHNTAINMVSKTINWKNAILAGIIGTLLFDLAGLALTGKSTHFNPFLNH